MISEYNLKFIKIRAEDEKKTLMMDMLGKFGPCVAPDMGDIDKVRIEPEDLWKYRKLGICRLKILDRLRIPQPWEVEEYLIGLQDKRENILNAVSN